MCGHAPSTSELQTGEFDGGGGGMPSSRYMTHSQTGGRSHYRRLSEINDNPSHLRMAVLTRQRFSISRTVLHVGEAIKMAATQPDYTTHIFSPHPLKTAQIKTNGLKYTVCTWQCYADAPTHAFVMVQHWHDTFPKHKQISRRLCEEDWWGHAAAEPADFKMSSKWNH